MDHSNWSKSTNPPEIWDPKYVGFPAKQVIQKGEFLPMTWDGQQLKVEAASYRYMT